MTNQKQIIKDVFETLSESLTGKFIIAGGAITDALYKKKIKDVDVIWQPRNTSTAVDTMTSAGFEKIEQEFTASWAREGYFGRVEIDNIVAVYKGKVKNQSVDIIITDWNPELFVETHFDLNIKKAWYDGEGIKFSDGARRDIHSGIITFGRCHYGVYARGKESAEKYDLKLDTPFGFMAHTMAYLQQRKENSFISRKYRERFVMPENRIDEGKALAGIVLAQSKDTLIEEDNAHHRKLWRAFNTEHNHPLLHTTVKVSCEDSHSYNEFRHAYCIILDNLHYRVASSMLSEWVMPGTRLAKTLGLDKDGDSASEKESLVREIATMTDSMSRKWYEDNNVVIGTRKIKITKYLHALAKKVNRLTEDAFKHQAAIADIESLRRRIETRMLTTTHRVHFSMNHTDLMRISTDQAWTSCQRVSVTEPTKMAYGTLGNHAGNTMVAYTERNGKWTSRCLIRVCEGGELFVEAIYSGESARFKGYEHSLKEQLEKLGFEVYLNHLSAGEPKALSLSNTIMPIYTHEFILKEGARKHFGEYSYTNQRESSNRGQDLMRELIEDMYDPMALPF